jgi:hypothetical protein
MTIFSSHDSRATHALPGHAFSAGFSRDFEALHADDGAPAASPRPQWRHVLQRERVIDAMLAGAYVASCALIGLAGATWIT